MTFCTTCGQQAGIMLMNQNPVGHSAHSSSAVNIPPANGTAPLTASGSPPMTPLVFLLPHDGRYNQQELIERIQKVLNSHLPMNTSGDLVETDWVQTTQTVQEELRNSYESIEARGETLSASRTIDYEETCNSFLSEIIKEFKETGNDSWLNAFISQVDKMVSHHHLAGAINRDFFLWYGAENGFWCDPETMTFSREKTEKCFTPARDLLTDVDYDEKHRRASVVTDTDPGIAFFSKFKFCNIQIHMPLSMQLERVLLDSKCEQTLYLETMKQFDFEKLPESFVETFDLGRMDEAFEQLMPDIIGNYERWHAFIDEGDGVDLIGKEEEVAAGEVKYETCKGNRHQQLAKQGFKFPLSSFDNNNPVNYRLLADINRMQHLPQFFAQAALAMYLAEHDDRVCGISVSGPETTALSLSNYKSELDILAFLFEKMGKPHIDMHCGEMTSGRVSLQACHDAIALAIEKIAPDRINHALSLKYLSKKIQREVGKRLVDGNICYSLALTSNEKIWNIFNGSHPFVSMDQMGVSTKLDTDDPAVFETNMNEEIKKLLERYHTLHGKPYINYSKLKEMLRNQARFAFVDPPGIAEDIFLPRTWTLRREFRGLHGPRYTQSEAAREITKRSLKARLQVQLELKLMSFERIEALALIAERNSERSHKHSNV